MNGEIDVARGVVLISIMKSKRGEQIQVSGRILHGYRKETLKAEKAKKISGINGFLIQDG